ncbi:hypothetical protein HWI79_3263 [Cryptosporidium felis]|nr:hypothetical protein HWI79_3263 [Cryptosporidium felis]
MSKLLACSVAACTEPGPEMTPGTEDPGVGTTLAPATCGIWPEGCAPPPTFPLALNTKLIDHGIARKPYSGSRRPAGCPPPTQRETAKGKYPPFPQDWTWEPAKGSWSPSADSEAFAGANLRRPPTGIPHCPGQHRCSLGNPETSHSQNPVLDSLLGLSRCSSSSP